MKKPRLSDNWNLFNDKTFEDKKYYLFNVSDGSIIKLNKISYDILEKCNGEHSLENIKKQVLQKARAIPKGQLK